VNAVDTQQRRTSLHWAVSVGSVECVWALLAHGASASIASADGETAFEMAVKGGDMKLVSLMKSMVPW
jgi:ankyrin repeat protein